MSRRMGWSSPLGTTSTTPSAAGMAQDRSHAADGVVLVVPSGDDQPILRDMAQLLPVPATVVALSPPWEDAGR